MEANRIRCAICLLLLALLCFPIAKAQQTVSAPANTPPQNSSGNQTGASSNSQSQASQAGDKTKETENKQKQEQTGTSNDRLFYTLPNFLTVETKDVPPLTVKQKFGVVAKGSFDYIQIPWYGLLAGISQAENSEPGYGQGAEGYGKRFGAAFADGTIENFMTGAVLPSLLHEDPRFYESQQGSFTHRAGYAVSRIFVTRTDSGREEFNFSEIFGSAISAGISTYSYHPQSDRTVGNTLSVWGSEVGYDTITIVVKEFWPDIRRKLQKKK